MEVSPTLITDVGLSRTDVSENTIYEAGGWNWQLFIPTANRITRKTTRASCDAFYRASCSPNSTMQTSNLYYLFSGTGGGMW